MLQSNKYERTSEDKIKQYLTWP